MKIVATAKYRDIWSGEVTAHLTAFRTRRQGRSATRYQWQQESGLSCGFVAGGFVSIDRAIKATQGHRMFKDVQR